MQMTIHNIIVMHNITIYYWTKIFVNVIIISKNVIIISN